MRLAPGLTSQAGLASPESRGPGRAQAEALGHWGQHFWARARPDPGGRRTCLQPGLSVHLASKARRAELKRALLLPWQPAPSPRRQFEFVQTISNKDLPPLIHSALK